MLRGVGTLLSLLVGVAWRASSLVVEVATASATIGVVEATALRVLGLGALDLSRSRVGDGAGNVLGGVVDVKTLVNVLWDRLNLGSQLLLDAVKVEPVFPVDQVDGETKVSETTGATNTVEVGLGVLGEIEVDDNVDGLNINTTGQQIGTNEVTAVAGAEVVEDAVTVLLEHASVRVEARVAKFGNLLGEKLNTGGRVAEDDGLVDVEAGEEGVQAVDLLLLFNKGVVLGDTAEGELVHEVDLVGVVHVLVLEVLDNDGESGREEHDLAVSGVKGDELIDGRGELGRQELVSLVHDERLGAREVGDTSACEIEDSAGSTNENVHSVVEADNVVLQAGTTSGDHDVDAEVLSERLAYLGCLESEFSCGDEHESLDLAALWIDALKSGDDEGGRLSSTVLCSCQYISSRECDGYCLLLNR